MKKVPNSPFARHLSAGFLFFMGIILFSSPTFAQFSSRCEGADTADKCSDCFVTRNASIDAACMVDIQASGSQSGHSSRVGTNSSSASGGFSACQIAKGRLSISQIDDRCGRIQGPEKSGSSDVTKTKQANIPLPPAKPAELKAGAVTPAKTTGPGTDRTTTPGGGQQQGGGSQQGQAGQQGGPACTTAQRRADSCCQNPDSCLTGAERAQVSVLRSSIDGLNANLSMQNDQSNQGLRDRCNQMSSLGVTSNRLNNIYTAACTRAVSDCTSTCGSTCLTGSIASAANMLNSQASMGGASGFGGNECNNSTGAMPQNAGGGGDGGGGQASNSPYNTANANANDPYGCQANPNSPACRGGQAADPRGDTGFGMPGEGSMNPNDFNVADANVTDPSSIFGGDGEGTMAGGEPGKYKTIPNNSGGGIPGGGGSSEAKLDPKSRSTASEGPSVNTNIEQGFRSGGGGGSAGGGYRNGGGGAGGEGDDGFDYNPQGSASNDPSGLKGLDLKRFLPGGSSDPGRFLGGNALSSQINGPSVDIWNRISNRLQQRCRLGLLFGCY